ncbi:unnamed protein product [Rotaria sordida]|uniref:Uncharacterized protein n=1 Tax=Rotaria sordida TaxID=392033 RepID=A0A816ESC8_9BILA|nr:unnamed protein product [Rotaria sordida]CAF1651279.1 unnamed protein product [Rotaria sordida]
MSNTYEGITTVLVPSVEVTVNFNDSDKSTTSIGTDYLGSCICFLFDFTYCDEQICVLDHYTYPKDEKGLSPDKVLALLMKQFVSTIKDNLYLRISEQIYSSATTVSNLRLLVVGGDPKESRRIRHTLSSLNANSFKLKAILNDPEHLYLAEQLINKIILLKSATRSLTGREEREGK